MNIFKKIAIKLKLIKPKQNWFKKFFKSFRSLFSLKSKKSKFFVITFVVLALASGFFVVYSQGSRQDDGPSINRGLVGHWTMDEEDYNFATSRVADKSGYENHGTNYGATFTTDRHGKEGGAMKFDGVSNRVSINYENPINETSVVAWFKKSGSPAGAHHIVVGGDKIEISIPDSSGQIRTGVTTDTQGRKVFNSGSGLNDGEWHQVAMTYNGSSLKSYIDGQLTATNSVSGKLVGTAREIGRYLSNSYAANGYIDDVRIYNRALSELEIEFLYSYEPKMQISSISKGLVGHWRLNEEDYNFTTNRVTDKTPYANHGTNYGATFTEDRHGKEGGAMSFNGSSNSINIGNPSNLSLGSEATISLWAKTDRDYPSDSSSTAFRGLIGKNKGGGKGQQSYYMDWIGTNSSRTLRFAIGDSDGSTSVNVNNFNFSNNWKHILVSWGGNYLQLWINGVLVHEVANSRLPQVLSNNLLIGDAFGKWDGYIEDVRIYNRALSESEIESLYDTYNPKTTTGSLQKGLILDMPLKLKYTKSETPGSEIMTDRTPNSNNGTNYGAIIDDEGATFNGTSQYIGNLDSNNPALFEPSSITVSSWINMDPNASTARHIWFTKWFGYSFEIQQTTRIPYFRLNGPGDIWSNKPITLGNWHHIVGTYDPLLGGRIYLDGEQVGSKPASGRQISHTRSHPLNIGRYYGGVYFDGKISNALIYNRALSEDEVKTLYDRGRSDAGIIFQEN